MQREKLREYLVGHILPRVQKPAQYLGGELNSDAFADALIERL